MVDERSSTRSLPDGEARRRMGATQFGLLVALGLRHFHRVLDFGCGSCGASGWVYPDRVAHVPTTIAAITDRAGLFGRPLPWFHPRQTWYVLARDPDRLPRAEHDARLRGAILNVPAWEESLVR